MSEPVRRMTRRRALNILMRAAGRDMIGAGVGIRGVPTGAAREEINRAAWKLWPDIYSWDEARTQMSDYGFEQPENLP